MRARIDASSIVNRAKLPPFAFETAWRTAQAMTMDEAFAFVTTRQPDVTPAGADADRDWGTATVPAFLYPICGYSQTCKTKLQRQATADCSSDVASSGKWCDQIGVERLGHSHGGHAVAEGRGRRRAGEPACKRSPALTGAS